MSPDDYGYLLVHLEYPEPHTFDVHQVRDPGVKEVVVDRADPVVSASMDLLTQLWDTGHIRDDVLTVGTPGRGLGVVTYRISEHPMGDAYRVLTLEGTDRDR